MNICDLPEWKNVHDLLVSLDTAISVEVAATQVIASTNASVGWGSIEGLADDPMGVNPEVIEPLKKLARRIRRQFSGNDIRVAGAEHWPGDWESERGLHLHGLGELQEQEWLEREHHGLKVEVAETLKSLEDLLEKADYQYPREHLLECHPEFSEKDIDRAVRGLREEDEFALMCRLMGTCTSLVRLDQKHNIPGDYSVPDFLASFSPGCEICGIKPEQVEGFRCFIDVKSCYEKPERMKIKSDNLKKLRTYARQFGLPLLFAVRFTKATDFAFWVIAEDSDPNATEIEIPPDAYYKSP
jgi:hypothetical protein